MREAAGFQRWRVVLVWLGLFALGGGGVFAAGDEEIRPGDVVVTFRRDTPKADLERLLADLGANPQAEVRRVFRSALLGFAGNLSPDLRAELEGNRWVESIEDDFLLELPLPTAVSEAGAGLDRVDQRDLPLDDRFHASLTGAGVNVYVIDTGVRITHEEFGGRASGAFSTLSESAGEDCFGHGTQVASVIGGEDLGVAKRANLQSVRVGRCSFGVLNSRMVEALDWVAENARRPAVVNVSAGSRHFNHAVAEAARGVVALGIPVVASAGNGVGFDHEPVSACELVPAGIAEVIAAGMSDTADSFTRFSGFGPCVDMVALGIAETAGHTSNSAVRHGFGTSFAAPLVTGVIALMLEADPSLTPAEIDTLLDVSATRERLRELPAGTPDRLLYGFFPQPHGARPWSVGDFDGDGDDDLVREASGRGAGVLLSIGERFEAQTGYWTNLTAGSQGYLVGDYNGDGKDDLARQSGTATPVEVLIARDGFFQVQGPWLSFTSRGLQGFKVGDFDGDGRSDLLRVLEISGRQQTEVFRSTGSSFVPAGVWISEGSFLSHWFVGDWNGDGRDDIARFMGNLFGLELLSSDGTRFVKSNHFTGVDQGIDGFRFGDFDGDGATDILVRSSAACTRIFHMAGNGGPFVTCRSTTDPGTEGWTIGDFDGDGRDDLLRSLRLQVGAGVELRNSQGSFTPAGDWAFEEPLP